MKTKRYRAAAAVCALSTSMAMVGCGEKSSIRSARDTSALVEAPASQLALAVENPAPAEGVRFSGLAGKSAAAPAANVNRKIIYNARVELAVEDFSGVPDRVVELVKKYDAYIADSNLGGTAGENRHGTWKIRVPVARFEEFVNSSKALGELINAGTSSSDVSEEFYDVEARIRNRTKEEERLLKLLEERPGKLEDVIAIERELSRVREDVERMQGRMRVLADLTTLTTVELLIREIRNYQPPQAPTLGTQVRRSFEGSLAGIRDAGEFALVAAVGLIPWLAVIAVLLSQFYLISRSKRRRRIAALAATSTR